MAWNSPPKQAAVNPDSPGVNEQLPFDEYNALVAHLYDSVSGDWKLAAKRIDLTGLSDDMIMVYDFGNDKFVFEAKSSTATLVGLTDTAISGVPAEGEVLAYTKVGANPDKWINQTAAEAGLATTTQLTALETAAVLEADFDATTFLYATSDDTPQPKTPAEVMAILSGKAGAEFLFNTQKIGGIVDPTTAQQAATKNYDDTMLYGKSILAGGPWTTGHVLAYNATSGKFEMVAQSGAGGGLTNPMTEDLDMGGNNLLKGFGIYADGTGSQLDIHGGTGNGGGGGMACFGKTHATTVYRGDVRFYNPNAAGDTDMLSMVIDGLTDTPIVKIIFGLDMNTKKIENLGAGTPGSSDAARMSDIGAASSWIGLSDTDPITFVGQSGKYVKVNAAANGLDFGTPSGSGDMTKAVYDSLDNGFFAIAQGGTGQTSALNAFNALKQAATTSYTGVVELATDGEASSGKVVQGNDSRLDMNRYIQAMIVEPATAVTTGVEKVFIHIPFAGTLTAIHAEVDDHSTSGKPTIDINKNGTTVLSTKLTIDANEKGSDTASVPAVISVAAVAENDVYSIDVDAAGTGTKGLTVTCTILKS